ncbi:hypothetical protein CC2G_010702 [Coprinopsis cinerea AmutBmut pab1-1]|nr:hypothetical protein CC2G_010702 [Coprinopsis cinerea AmutBmut pab1-1]
MRAFFVLSALVSTALGYLVTRPNQSQGWTNQGPQTVHWERVSTDPETFALVLTNVNRDLLPSDIVLASSVDGTSATSFTVEEPEGGWPAHGGSYRVNLVRSERELNTILAQSSEFNITASSSTPSSSSRGASVSGSVTHAAHSSTASSTATRSNTIASGSGVREEEAVQTNADDDMVAPGSGSASSLHLPVVLAGAAALLGGSLVM